MRKRDMTAVVVAAFAAAFANPVRGAGLAGEVVISDLHIFWLVMHRHTLKQLVTLEDDRAASDEDCAVLSQLVSLPGLVQILDFYHLPHRTELLFALFIFWFRKWSQDLESQSFKCQVSNGVSFSLLAGFDYGQEISQGGKRPALNFFKLFAVVHIPLKVEYDVDRDGQKHGLGDFLFHKRVILVN
jgi:hypothetical protein